MLIDLLNKHGLGDLLISHVIKGVPTLCNITYVAGELVLRPNAKIKYDPNVKPSDCKGELLGVITKADNEEWKGMTFLGLSYCDFNMDSSKDYINRIKNIKNQYGDSLIDFKGSIYRAYQLSLDNDILPIISMHALKTKNGKYGLAVNNLSSGGHASSEKTKIYEALYSAVEKKLTYSLDELNLPEESFADLFGRYTNDVA
jgi:hypothetical protein